MAINSRIHILKYNTYFDRIYKKEDTVEEYDQYLLYDNSNVPGIFNVDFKPADGVNATQIINWSGDEPNYLIVINLNNNEIISRWFVMEYIRIRGGQYQMSLKRDVVADNFDDIVNSTAYINKAILPDSNVLIYNQEPITTNQIKTKEIELKDDTKCAWIVGYIARNTPETTLTVSKTNLYYDYSVNKLSDWQYYNMISNPYWYNRSVDFLIRFFQTRKLGGVIKYYIKNFAELMDYGLETSGGYTVKDASKFRTWLQETSRNEEIWNAINNYNKLYDPYYGNKLDDTDIFNSDGKILRVGSSSTTYKYYKISVKDQTFNSTVTINSDKSGNYLYTYFNNLLATYDGKASSSSGNAIYELQYSYRGASVSLEELSTNTANVKIPKDRSILLDAPYDMFCIPYADNQIITLGTDEFTIDKITAVQIAQGIASSLGGAGSSTSNIYDLQLLPYAPFTGYQYQNNKLIINFFDSEARLTKITDTITSKTISCLIWCTESSGTKNIVLDSPITYENKKIENQCNTYRLVSPNFAGQFEFNLARNNTTSLNVFNVDYTYMPYNPYIHINPAFDGLYGKDFNDIRGLVCGGDFSLASTSDAWTNYQIQNKNYQAIFDRETKTLDINHKYDLQQNILSAVLGSVQGSASGMQAGAAAGPVGAAIGAAIGGTLSLAGGAGDIAYGEARYNEAMKYRKDIFNMKLENIQALPYSISKTTAYTYNNKIFPILEFYTCTDEEKLVFANLIANSSMTVQAIGTLSNYLYNTWSYGDIKSRGYLSCQIIKLGNLSADAHMQYAIADEMEKGLYFGG